MPTDQAERDAIEYDRRHPPRPHNTIHYPLEHVDQ
ncbi:hypothetical protein JOE65_000674 [Arthrobacter roseus]|nr:hypothetical protein [Arthrobacter roseus]